MPEDDFPAYCVYTRTAIWVVEQLTEAKFDVLESPEGTLIRCRGIGYQASKGSLPSTYENISSVA